MFVIADKKPSLIPDVQNASRARWIRDYEGFLTQTLKMGPEMVALMWCEAMQAPESEYGA